MMLKLETFRKVGEKYLESFEVWCWRRMEKVIWTDLVRDEVSHRVKKERNTQQTIQTMTKDWIGYILRRNCLLKHVIEGKLEGRIKVTGRRGRRRNHLMDDGNKKIRYRKLKPDELDRNLWRTVRLQCDDDDDDDARSCSYSNSDPSEKRRFEFNYNFMFGTLALPVLHIHISQSPSSGQRNRASWTSQPQKSVTLRPQQGGEITQSIRDMWWHRGKERKKNSKLCRPDSSF
jgi:hypothetical protein